MSQDLFGKPRATSYPRNPALQLHSLPQINNADSENYIGFEPGVLGPARRRERMGELWTVGSCVSKCEAVGGVSGEVVDYGCVKWVNG